MSLSPFHAEITLIFTPSLLPRALSVKFTKEWAQFPSLFAFLLQLISNFVCDWRFFSSMTFLNTIWKPVNLRIMLTCLLIAELKMFLLLWGSLLSLSSTLVAPISKYILTNFSMNLYFHAIRLLVSLTCNITEYELELRRSLKEVISPSLTKSDQRQKPKHNLLRWRLTLRRYQWWTNLLSTRKRREKSTNSLKSWTSAPVLDLCRYYCVKRNTTKKVF